MKGRVRSAVEFKEIFGDRYYLELQDHTHRKAAGPSTTNWSQMSASLDIPLVATNDVHYLNDTDADPHQVLLCVQTSTTMDDPKKMNYGSQGVLPEDRSRRWPRRSPDTPDALARTRGDRRPLQSGLGVRTPRDALAGRHAGGHERAVVSRQTRV